MVVHHHAQGLTCTHQLLVTATLCLPSISEIQTNTFPNLGPSLLSTSVDTGNRGAWTNIPKKPQTLKSLSGIDIKYSWKKVE